MVDVSVAPEVKVTPTVDVLDLLVVVVSADAGVLSVGVVLAYVAVVVAVSEVPLACTLGVDSSDIVVLTVEESVKPSVVVAVSVVLLACALVVVSSSVVVSTVEESVKPSVVVDAVSYTHLTLPTICSV